MSQMGQRTSTASSRSAVQNRLGREAQGRGSHRVLSRQGWPDYVWAFHDNDEIGPSMLARIAKHTGLRPENL